MDHHSSSSGSWVEFSRVGRCDYCLTRHH